MCHLQSSGPMLPSAAATPPCAATVCERVGNTLVMQAVRSPACEQPTVARSPAPPAPTTITSNVCSVIGKAARIRAGAALPLNGALEVMPLTFEISSPLGDRRVGGPSGNAQFQDRASASQADANRKNKIGDQRPLPQLRSMHVIVDNRLHSELHVKDPGQDEEKHQNRWKGMPEFGSHRRIILAEKRQDDRDEYNRQGHQSDRGNAHFPCVRGAGIGGAKEAHPARRRRGTSRHDCPFLPCFLAM